MARTPAHVAEVSGNGTSDLEVRLPPLDLRDITISVVGTSPLICHRWSSKARLEMQQKRQKKAKQAREAENPEQLYRESMYQFNAGFDDRTEAWDGKTYGVPATAFKNAAVHACSHISGITKVIARGAFHVELGKDLVKIEGVPQMREDMTRIAMGTADIRYRGEFRQWSASFKVRYNASVLSAEQIAHLFETAGFCAGVGEWRPERGGSYGMFRVRRESDA